MNRLLSKLGSLTVSAAVLVFAVFLLLDFSFGSYFVCMLLPIGYIMMAAGFCSESDDGHRVAANIGLVFAAIYAVLIFLVYFAQTTAVRLGNLGEQAMAILDFKRGGLLFGYDLLGYGMMALSTFFIGLTVKADNRADKWLKYLMIIHGIFFFGCFIMPMTGVFTNMATGETGNGGTIALLIWCVFFFPIGVLAYKHFEKTN